MQNDSPANRPAAARSALANLGRMAGAVGFVLWASSPLTFILTDQMGLLVFGKLIVGTLLIGLYLATNRGFFARLIGSRSLRLVALSSVTTGLLLVLVGALNYAAYTHPWERDMTREGLYTLSPQTRQCVGALGTDVHIYAFFGSYEQAYPLVDELLGRYAQLGARLTYEMVDPQARPDLTERFQITDRGPRLVLVARDQDARVKDLSEEQLTHAIIKVSEQTAKKVYVLQGHGELDSGDIKLAEGAKQFVDAIASEGYETALLDLRTLPAPQTASPRVSVGAPAADVAAPKGAGLRVPEDAAVVLILGPMQPLLPPEVDSLTAFVHAGGRLMLFLEPHVTTGLESLLRTWHIEVCDDLIVDTNPLNRLLGLGAAAPMVQPVHGEHPIVHNLHAAMVMSTARSLRYVQGGAAAPAAEAEAAADGVQVTPLAHTAETAWGETKLHKDGTAQKDAEDHLPPLFVAMAAEQCGPQLLPGPEGGQGTPVGQRSGCGRLVVYGDSDFVTNHYLKLQGNQDFVLNGLNWLSEQEHKITIRPKSRVASQLYLSGEQMNLVKFVCMDILPVLIIAVGLGITVVRRQR